MRSFSALATRDCADDCPTGPAAAPAAPLARARAAENIVLALLTVILLFVVLFWRLGTPSFWDPDEAHYAQTTHEMVASGDWFAPRYNGQPFFDKPALFHQLQGAAMVLFEDPEFASRIVPSLAALGLIAVTFWFGTTVVSSEMGFVAALMLAASPGVFALARYAILDTLFTLCTFGGAACLAVAVLRDRPRLQWVGYIGLAFGVLTKGPIALVLCGLTFLIAIAASSGVRSRLLRTHWFAGLAIVAAVSAPWFLYMYLRFRQDFVNGYLLDENFRLFAGSRFGNQPGFLFYFQILAAGLLPWTGLLIGRLVDDVRAIRRGESLDGLEILLWSWTAAVVGFFTLSTFKLDHYVFPAAPALCLLCARAWVDVRADQWASRNAAARIGLHFIGPFLIVVGLGCGFFLIARLALPPSAVIVPVVLVLAGAMLTAWTSVRRGLPPRAPWIVMIALTVTYGGLIAFVLPALEQRKVVPDVAQWVASHAQVDDRVASYRLNRWNPAYRFYVGRQLAFLEDAGEAEEFFASSARTYCVMQRSAYDELVARGLPLQIVYAREGMWATSGRALWRTYTPPATFVVVTRNAEAR
jgi:4-amino-4-deoxy-L-arabinose transferase-like glycosyltransferase